MDKEKIDEIYRENAAMIYKYLCGLTQDSGLAKKLWYKELEKRSRHKTAPLDDMIPSTENIENKSLDNLEKIEIFRLMHNLDDITREVMYLRLAGELQFSEIAAILGKTENWARVTYYRGKQNIMKGMKKWK